MKLLFVCTGNTCRSPLAEAMARAASRQAGVPAECASAGLMTGGGEGASEGSRVEAARRGLDLSEHRSRPVTDELLAWADLVVCMTASHARALPSGPGSPPSCLVTAFLPEGDPRRNTDIGDPFGGTSRDYERTAGEIEAAVEALIEAIGSSGRPPRSPTPRFAVLGDPVAHSRSPEMHAAGFRALGIDATYERIRVRKDRPGDLAGVMRELVASGGGGNVTVPHKATASRALDIASESVEVTGACNCFWLDASGSLAGDNTDVVAIRSSLCDLLEKDDAGVLVLGAGGAAAAAVYAAHGVGASIRLANRSPDRAERLRDRFGAAGIRIELVEWPPVDGADVVLNATSLGMQPEDPLPCSFDEVGARAAIDLVYGGVPTRWAAAAEQHGIPLIDGREILLRQGAACYPLWFGVSAPVAALRAGLEAVGG